jgi:hypothetical protein
MSEENREFNTFLFMKVESDSPRVMPAQSEP